MKESLNDQFPPTNSNGKAKKTEPVHDRPAGQTTNSQSNRVESKHQTEERPQRGASRQQQPSRNETRREALSPAELLKAKVSAYVAKHPLQTIGGLLAMLVVVVLFKTFYQGKNWKAKRMAEEAYYVANQYARNNSTNLHPYLSRAFRREVRQLPGLLPLSMQTATRGGSIAGAESIGLREVTPDSVVVEVALRYENGREEKRYQPLVYEKEQWRLGLTYSR